MPPRGTPKPTRKKPRAARPDGDDAGARPDGPDGDPPSLEGPATKASLGDHWSGWLGPLTGIAGLTAAYFAYDGGLLPESLAGGVIVVAIVGLAVATGAWEAFRRVAPASRPILIGGVAVWGLVSAWQPLRLAIPITPLATARVAEDKDRLETTIEVPGEAGPYEMTVSGVLRGNGEAEAGYVLTVTGDGGGSTEVSGDVKRTYFRQRVSRRSNATAAVRSEHTEQNFRLGDVRGGKLTVKADSSDEALLGGLSLEVHKAGLPPWVFWAFGVLALLAGWILDYRFTAPKLERTHFSTAAGFLLVFSTYLPFEATRHAIVPPAVAAAFIALLAGSLPAWIVSSTANWLKPKPKGVAAADSD